MPDYRHLYAVLFNAMTRADELIDNGSYSEAQNVLREAQMKTEEEYLLSKDPSLIKIF